MDLPLFAVPGQENAWNLVQRNKDMEKSLNFVILGMKTIFSKIILFLTHANSAKLFDFLPAKWYILLGTNLENNFKISSGKNPV